MKENEDGRNAVPQSCRRVHNEGYKRNEDMRG